MKKRSMALTILAISFFFLSGCATTNQRSMIDNLNSRISMLEDTVRRRDSEIAGLHSRADQLSKEIAKKDQAIKSLTPAPKPVTTTKDSIGVIRVDTTVENVQTALKNAGYYDGNVDGKIGPRTINSIAAFQKDNGLKQDSIIGQKTWDLLKQFLK